MFAGAAREVVFSDPEVVQKIKDNFVPVALKAGLVNNPPGGIEGTLYREIERTKAAPQGICVMNSGGKVLDWALSFDDDDAMRKFFDYAVERFREHPDASNAITTRRYRNFPNFEMESREDNGDALKTPATHEHDLCPAVRRVPKGTLIGKVIGRPLDDHGKPIEASLRQEEYMEAMFDLPVEAQRALVSALNEAGDSKEIAVPESFAEAIVGPAYLGQLDVSPLQHVPTGKNRERWWEFKAERLEDKPDTLRITGRSHIAGDGQHWDHTVTLAWQGYLTIEDGLLQQLDLLGKGHERLVWHKDNMDLKTRPASATLMGGHPIDINTDVIYGLSASGK